MENPSPLPPQVFKAAKDAAPPDREEVRLGFGSDDTENTNDARGDHICGHSGAQATAHEAALKTNTEDGVMATPFILPIRSSSCSPLTSARPHLPMPLVSTPPALFDFHHAKIA